MKPNYSFFRIFTALLLFTTVFHHNFLFGQTLDSRPGVVPKKIEFRRIAKTTDKLFINDSTYFWMDKTPIGKFFGYKKIYKDKVEPYGNAYELYVGLVDPDPTTNYMVIWCLNDSLLCLSDILPNVSFDKIEETFPDDELYKRMEKLTGRKFNKKYKNHTSYTVKEYEYNGSIRYKLLNPLGAMPATWFSDTIIVKTDKNEKNYREWKNIPCRELIFKGGRLISERIREDIH